MSVTLRCSHDRPSCDGTFRGSTSVTNDSDETLLASLHASGVYECDAQVPIVW